MTPAARIEIAGKAADPRLIDRLVSLTVTDEAGTKADTFELVVDARGGLSVPPIGAEVRVWLGYEPSPVYRGRFRITEYERSGPLQTVSISAHAADLSSKIRAPKMRSFHETTVKAIVEDVAGANGLTAIVDEEIGAHEVEHIDQQGESDVAFLSRLAKRHGATFKLGAGKVLFAAKGSRSLPDGQAKQAVTIRPEDVSRWSMRVAKRGEYDGASATYIDTVTGKRKTAKAGSGERLHRDRRLYGSKAEAAAAAAAKLGEQNRGERTGDVEGPGMPTLYAEALVTLKGFDADVDGTFLAKSVSHSYSSSGYTTSVSLETLRAPAGEG